VRNDPAHRITPVGSQMMREGEFGDLSGGCHRDKNASVS
jgi:hypothetical protein